ncbi:pyridoxal-phosphate dependent enzyme [Candidatus Bipolaricaulota bacterium]|nr:pyridoxal-phosphate dependent enzyme [Candidatus Bipolaricaulota bacterium]
MDTLPEWSDVLSATRILDGIAHRTPVLTCRTLDHLTGAHVFLKCENFQRTGSFKFRGAFTAVRSLDAKQRRHGVITHSSGNFAQALALAARLEGITATVIMPEDSTPAKLRASRGYGARVILCKPVQASRVEATRREQQKSGATFVDSHDDARIIAGQGTAVFELVEQIQSTEATRDHRSASPLDVVLAPVGGGGLLAGTAIAAKHLCPALRVIGCEPSAADDAFRSLQEGRRIVDFVPRTIADGLRTPLGEMNFAVIRSLVDEIITVSEAEIVGAMRWAWERLKVIIEPSSAVALAPLLARTSRFQGDRVGVVLSGGNVDLDPFFATMPGPYP